MSQVKQSDAAIVLLNVANKDVRNSAEPNEGRDAAKGNLRSQSTYRTQRQESVSQAAFMLDAANRTLNGPFIQLQLAA